MGGFLAAKRLFFPPFLKDSGNRNGRILQVLRQDGPPGGQNTPLNTIGEHEGARYRRCP